MLKLKPLVHRILEDYALRWDGTHGVGHWARVLENGLRLADATGAKGEIVQLFAVFHDSRRVSDGGDHGHGQRGAELAAELRHLFTLSDANFELLYEACARHTDGLTEADITIQTCWDSDRLDLGRVGMIPAPKLLCTPAARAWEMIQWADGRAAFEVVPDLVKSEWGIDLGGWFSMEGYILLNTGWNLAGPSDGIAVQVSPIDWETEVLGDLLTALRDERPQKYRERLDRVQELVEGFLVFCFPRLRLIH